MQTQSQIEAVQLVLHLPQHADHQALLIHQQVEHLVLLQDQNFLFLHKEFYTYIPTSSARGTVQDSFCQLNFILGNPPRRNKCENPYLAETTYLLTLRIENQSWRLIIYNQLTRSLEGRRRVRAKRYNAPDFQTNSRWAILRDILFSSSNNLHIK